MKFVLFTCLIILTYVISDCQDEKRKKSPIILSYVSRMTIGEENPPSYVREKEKTEIATTDDHQDEELSLKGKLGDATFNEDEIKIFREKEIENTTYPKYEGDVDGWLKNITCDICEYLVKKLQTYINETEPYHKLVNETIRICILYDVADVRICTMMVNQFKDEIHYVVVNLVLLPGEVCGIILGKKCYKAIHPFYMWNVTLPDTPKPPPKPPTPPKEGAPTIRFLQITDLHLDFQYEEGAPSLCAEPICCRNNVNGTGKAGKYGSYEKCDLPYTLVTELFKHLADIQDKFDYIIFTGDIPAHDLWNQSQAAQVAHIRVLDAMFQTYLPFKPVYYAIGNHESSPCESFPPPSLNIDMSWLYDPVADIWGRWLPPETDDMIRRCASYSFSPVPGFRIISLNNIYSSKFNLYLFIDDVDPCGVLEFFIKELQKAEDAGEKVHVLTHIPPGDFVVRKPWSYNYYRIVNRYENTIVNQFYGHVHKDYYEIFYDNVTFERPLGVGFAAPSVTSWSDLNPTYRIYTMDGNYEGSSWAVLDYVTYYLNLGEVNEGHRLRWKFEYSPKELFNMKSLYPADWNDLINRMADDDDLFQKFYRVYHNNHPPTIPCIGFCKKNLLCQLREARSFDRAQLCKNIYKT